MCVMSVMQSSGISSSGGHPSSLKSYSIWTQYLSLNFWSGGYLHLPSQQDCPSPIHQLPNSLISYVHMNTPLLTDTHMQNAHPTWCFLFPHSCLHVSPLSERHPRVLKLRPTPTYTPYVTFSRHEPPPHRTTTSPLPVTPPVSLL